MVQHHTGSAQELHDLAVPTERTVMVMHVSDPALVLGSTQDRSNVDDAALRGAGVQLARRSSGGGAVLLVPGEHVWIDLALPAGDPLWVDDVVSSSWWVGDAWAALLGSASVAADVHRGGVTDRDLGRLVCFGATGPGEVVVAGRKLVGVSQRRTRAAARFQCVVHARFDAGATLSLLSAATRSPALVEALDARVTGLSGCGIEAGWDVVEQLGVHLP